MVTQFPRALKFAITCVASATCPFVNWFGRTHWPNAAFVATRTVPKARAKLIFLIVANFLELDTNLG